MGKLVEGIYKDIVNSWKTILNKNPDNKLSQTLGVIKSEDGTAYTDLMQACQEVEERNNIDIYALAIASCDDVYGNLLEFEFETDNDTNDENKRFSFSIYDTGQECYYTMNEDLKKGEEDFYRAFSGSDFAILEEKSKLENLPLANATLQEGRILASKIEEILNNLTDDSGFSDLE